MEREQIIRMAREAGLHKPYWEEDQDPKVDPPHWAMASPIGEPLERFAALVAAAAAAAEREACALTCENETVKDIGPGDEAYNSAVQHCAYAIRERGEKP